MTDTFERDLYGSCVKRLEDSFRVGDDVSLVSILVPTGEAQIHVGFQLFSIGATS
jgi:hypothetical protein